MTPQEQFDFENPPLDREGAGAVVFGCITWALLLFGVIAALRAVF